MSNFLVRTSQATLGGSLALLHTTLAQAQAGGGTLPIGVPDEIANKPGFQSVTAVIRTVFNLVIIIAGTIFVILLLVGGIQYLTAAGNEEATGKAKRLIVDSIVGLVIVLAAWAIGTFIIGRLGFKSTTGGVIFE